MKNITLKQISAFNNLTLLLVGMVALTGAGIGGFLASGWANEIFAGAVQGSGRIETEIRTLGEFDSIAIVYPGTIIIQQGEANWITVEADDNLLQQLATEVRNGVLAIENSEDNYFKRVTPTQAIKMTIIVKDLKEITLVRPARVEVNGLKTNKLAVSIKGIGDIFVKDLKVDSLNVYQYGGKVTVAGTADNLSVSIGKNGEFNSADLQALEANVQIGGTTSATVRVSKSILVSLNGSAAVNYYGSPETIRESIRGTAYINKLGD